jgi:hypothetical protein
MPSNYVSKGLKTHCRKGHEFTPKNTVWRKKSGRRCRMCMEEQKQRTPDYYILNPKRFNQNTFKTHCKRGHEFTIDNTLITSMGRACRICRDMHRIKARQEQPFYERDRCREQKAILVSLKGGHCYDCDGVFPDCCYHFHHRDPRIKTFDLGQNMLRSLSVLKAEAEKCDLLCANCHAIKSYGDTVIAEKTKAGIARSKGK